MKKTALATLMWISTLTIKIIQKEQKRMEIIQGQSERWERIAKGIIDAAH
jgi:hypothetical protein